MENTYKEPTETEQRIKQQAKDSLKDFLQGFEESEAQELIDHLMSGYQALFRLKSMEIHKLEIERDLWKDRAHKLQTKK